MKNKVTYNVLVGNVGNLPYTSKNLAIECFTTYKTLSISEQTRCAGESVFLMDSKGDILMEHIGHLTEQDI